MPRKPSLDTLRALILRLPLEHKQELYSWLADAIAAEETVNLTDFEKPNAAVTEQRHYQGKTYQLEKRRCGKATCKCMVGDLAEVGHGPYWYTYWKSQDKVRSQYVGKTPPWQTRSADDKPE